MRRSYLVPGVAIVLIAGFLLFRPDKLFADDPVAESLNEAFATTTSSGSATTSVGAALPSSTGNPATSIPAATATTSPGPTALATGQLTGIDHRAEGTAAIYEEGGRYVLRFEDDTDIQNGPDLYVWVIEGGAYESGLPSRYLDLGKLKGNVGGQNYELPDEFDPTTHRGVLVWCLRFAVPFAFAPLT
ncbi:MAG TPA: DM13 domain-containing protein [Acidimicrobiia bacterium]|nr:DM13 domain-containing protein [Acidimicrobiia bacterium]